MYEMRSASADLVSADEPQIACLLSLEDVPANPKPEESAGS